MGDEKAAANAFAITFSGRIAQIGN